MKQSGKRSGGLAGLFARWPSQQTDNNGSSRKLDPANMKSWIGWNPEQVSRARRVEATDNHQCDFCPSGGWTPFFAHFYSCHEATRGWNTPKTVKATKIKNLSTDFYRLHIFVVIFIFINLKINTTIRFRSTIWDHRNFRHNDFADCNWVPCNEGLHSALPRGFKITTCFFLIRER